MLRNSLKCNNKFEGKFKKIKKKYFFKKFQISKKHIMQFIVLSALYDKTLETIQLNPLLYKKTVK